MYFTVPYIARERAIDTATSLHVEFTPLPPLHDFAVPVQARTESIRQQIAGPVATSASRPLAYTVFVQSSVEVPRMDGLQVDRVRRTPALCGMGLVNWSDRS